MELNTVDFESADDIALADKMKVGRQEIVAELASPGALRQKLLTLGERAVKRAGAASDNTTAAAVRWLGV